MTSNMFCAGYQRGGRDACQVLHNFDIAAANYNNMEFKLKPFKDLEKMLTERRILN